MEPPLATLEPPTATAEPPPDTVEPPTVTVEPPTETAEPPPAAVEQQPKAVRKPITEMTVEEMIAKAIVPVKKEFICSAPTRVNTDNNNNNLSNDVVSVTPSVAVPVIEKKSKRQLKRERHQEKQSTRNLCSMVAKTGKADSCPFNDKCRYSHDIEAYKAQLMNHTNMLACTP
ncbi:hypothetical protein CTI12_AA395540 [Artemisia annua]|uniref:C3H1-type domain-containing protein n=1 Tax=Artemisia annua TaxID=35608 RepID=A0A2U1MCJ9_ARTAN|nr:hypothetical protein CTI12_AA395540 [Artemisia annua]